MIALIEWVAVMVAAFPLFVVAWRWPLWTVFIAILGGAGLDLLWTDLNGVDIGVNLYADDAACAVLIVTGFLACFRFRRQLSGEIVPALILLVIVVVSFARGISQFGLKSAGNSARNLTSFALPGLVIMLLLPAFRMDVGRLARWMVWVGLSLSSVALLRWVDVLPTPAGLQENMREVVRAIGADYAIIIGLALISAIYLSLVSRRNAWWWTGAGTLAVVVFALQHRSVWVSTTAGLAWLVFRIARRVSILRWFGLGTIALAGLGALIVAAPQVLNSSRGLIDANVQEAEKSDSTWAWRVAGYQEAVNRVFAGETIDMLIGPPAGWAANSGGSFASTHIHSRYVDTLAYYGVFGLAFLIAWVGVVVKRVGWPARLPSRGLARNRAGGIFLEALLIAEMVYLFPYFGTILEGAVLGLIWVAAKQLDRPIAIRRVAFAHQEYGPLAH